MSQEMEFFLACHENAFAAFGLVPARLMIDNLKSAVLKRLVGAAPVFNPKYLDPLASLGLRDQRLQRRLGLEKGRVENGLATSRRTSWPGREFIDSRRCSPPPSCGWTRGPTCVHGATQRRPVDMFEEERVKLRAAQPRRIRPRARAHGQREQAVPRRADSTPTRCPRATSGSA
ncbi:MAG: transposase [Betaproteobacteria bacterium]|nr:transposase [Betaproteobacteria bacterium]